MSEAARLFGIYQPTEPASLTKVARVQLVMPDSRCIEIELDEHRTVLAMRDLANYLSLYLSRKGAA